MSKKSTKSAPKDKQVATYKERDIVLGKVRGFPPWPGMVVNPDSVPPAVQQERPAKKSNFYCVQFFPAGDYAWLVPKDISKLQHVEIEAYINEPFKKSGELLAGYRTALDPSAWEAQRAAALAAADDEDDDDEDEDDNDEDVQEDGGDGEVDELADEEHDGGGGKKRRGGAKGAGAKAKSLKRKRESTDGATARKGAGAGAKTKTKERKAAGSGMSSRKSKTSAVVESEDERADPDRDAEGEVVVGSHSASAAAAKNTRAASPPPAKKPRREEDPDEPNMQGDPEAIKVRDWRHKLQKAFLSAKTTPDDADMPALDTLFSTVEAYNTMTVAYLQFSKIGKVMRHITLLDDKRVPLDAKFNFRARAQALVERWQSVLGAAKDGRGAGGAGAPPPPKKEEGEEEEKKKGAEGGLNGVNGAAAAAEAEAEAAINGAVEETKVDLNGASADTTAHMDVDAAGDADGEGDVAGQADAQGEAEDTAAMAEDA